VSHLFSKTGSARQPLLLSSRDETTKFYDSLFLYAESGYVQFRCFYDKGEDRTGTPLQPWQSASVTDRGKLIDTAVAVATAAANHPPRTVFAPPVCTFRVPYTGKDTGREDDIAEGLAISTEIDTASPGLALSRLTNILGVPPTVILHSGGIYVDEQTGEVEDKLHLHWRLTEPTRTPEDYAVLKECRRLAKLIANGDGSNVPAVHPVRWAGSWHRKNEPRMATGEYNPENEVELREAYEALREAAPVEQRDPKPAKPDRADRGDREPVELGDILSALDVIPNLDLEYQSWKEIGAAIWDGASGSPAGKAAFHMFGQKSKKYDATSTEIAWKQLTDCPFAHITVGSLFHKAREADPSWISPSYRRRRDADWREQARETSEFIKSAKANADTQEAPATEKPREALDPTRAYIDELARLDLVEFCKRLPEAARKLEWTRGTVERCVKDARRKIKEQAKAAWAHDAKDVIRLAIGSDAEIAERVRQDMDAGDQLYVHTEGSFWHWTGRVWEALTDGDVQEDFIVSKYDGARYGDKGMVRLNHAHVKSIAHFLRHKKELEDFFVEKPAGINLENCFVGFNDDGSTRMEQHNPAQLSRHLLRGSYRPGFTNLPLDSLLAKFLATMFRYDPELTEKVLLMQEAAGASLIGASKKWVPQPKALILLGRTANNGKSQFLALCEGLTGGACSHVAAHQFDDQNIVIHLRGAILNSAGELTSSQSIASDVFKAAVTNEILHGKILFEDKVEFRPQAQHIFATNKLPPFAGGIDKGCRRRLLVLDFAREIPVNEMIPDIAAKILDREYDLLLNWAIEGAARLIRQKGFTVPQSSVEVLDQWVRDIDAVVAWMRDRVTQADDKPGWPGYKPSEAFDMFHQWAEQNHHEKRYLPKIQEFSARMADTFPGCKRTAKTNRFRGITIHAADASDVGDIQAEMLRNPSPRADEGLWMLMDKADAQYRSAVSLTFMDRMMGDTD
jgi:phage/plasmid-associated DNA primase